jgi:hypothetical protein
MKLEQKKRQSRRVACSSHCSQLKMKKENDNRIYLRFREFVFSPDEISDKLNLEPSDFGIKGSSYFVGPEKRRIEKKLKWNFWEYRFRKV